MVVILLPGPEIGGGGGSGGGGSGGGGSSLRLTTSPSLSSSISPPPPLSSPSSPPSSTVNIRLYSTPQVPEYQTKEEEWIKKKKTEVVTKRQIATRVQREVLLKDGKVVEDSGPKVTTTTTEDTTKQESENVEHHELPENSLPPDWRPVTDDPNLLTEVREKKVTTRQETNETIETEDVKHLGNISDKAYQRAIENGGGGRPGSGDGHQVDRLLALSPGTEVSGRGPRLVSHHTLSRKTTDTEDTVKTSALDSSGNIVTNTSTIKDHEVVKELDAPDEAGDFEDFDVTKHNEISKTRSQEFVETVKENGEVERTMRYDAEKTEAKRHGDKDWESLSARLRRNRNRFLKEMEEERKDALTKRPLDFSQEEKARKVLSNGQLETSKWLEHHFGSESASSSRSRSSEDEGPHQTSSFISVTMKSAKDPKPPSRVFLSSPEPSSEKSYFKGVSEWKSDEKRTRSPRIEGVQVLPTGPNHTFSSSPSPPYPKSPSPPNYTTKSPSPPNYRTKSPSPPVYRTKSPSPPVYRTKSPSPTTYRTKSSNSLNYGSKTPSPPHHYRTKSPSPPFVGTKLPSTHNIERNGLSPADRLPPVGAGERYVKTERYYRHERSTSPSVQDLPPVTVHQYNGSRANGGSLTPPVRTYTPTSISPPPRQRRARRSQRTEDHLQQADQQSRPEMEEPIPDYSPTPEPKSPHSPSPNGLPHEKKKVYQRTRFAADIPPPPMKSEHQQQGSSRSKTKEGKSLGESFRRLVGRLRGGGGGGSRRSGGGGSGSPSPGGGGGSVVHSGTQTSDKEAAGMTTLHRYYLGEDPFQPSIYPGKESEYPRKKTSDIREEINSFSTLGRLSKSTGRLSSGGELRAPGVGSSSSSGLGQHRWSKPTSGADRGGVQTLPRKLHQEHRTKKQVYVTRSNGESSHQQPERYRLGGTGSNSNSMFNVSSSSTLKNGLNGGGPAKPARTYRSNLLRSKSFNIHGLDADRTSSRYTSNPQLHRLDEESPLKSPGIVTSISRSTRDLTNLPEDIPNGYTNYRATGTTDVKKRLFGKSFLDREYYRPLNENELRTSTPLRNGKVEYSTSFRSDSPLRSYSPYRSSPEVNKSIVRRGSNDYTETVSYTTKSDDPLRPSVTNTVQSITKKTVPVPGGRTERIESSTKTETIRKSHFRSGTPELSFDSHNKYSPNGGVVIEVRNTRK